MKKSIITFAIIAIFLFTATLAYGYAIDGNLTDWGVTPFSDWAPASPTAQWAEGNHTGSGAYPNGGEAFDIEALYADMDEDFLYIAIVFSMPPEGVDDPYGRDRHYFAGDIALDLDDDDSTGEDGFEFAIGTHADNIGQIIYLPDWSLPNGSVGFPVNGPSDAEGGLHVGDAVMAYVNAGDLEGNDTDTFIIETAVALSDLGNAEDYEVHFTLDCGNDLLEVSGFAPTQAIPEPGTIAIIGAGLAFAAGIARKRLNM